MKRYITLQNINLSALSLYILILFYAQYSCAVSPKPQIPILVLLILSALVITKILFVKCQKVSFKKDISIITKKERNFWIIGAFLSCLLVLGIYYLGYFPGSFSMDSEKQLLQAVSKQYSDWHPVMHTLLFFNLPLKMFHEEEMIVLFQIICFSAVFSYLIYTLKKAGCPRAICIMQVAFVLMAPVTGAIMIHPWKDCGFAIFSMISVAQYIELTISKGKWLNKKRNFLAFSICLVLTALMRHNAVLFVVPLTISVIVHGIDERKRVAEALALAAVILISFKSIVYPMMGVEKPGNRVRESVGLCMAVMGNALVNAPDQLPLDVRSFLYQVASEENWKSNYRLGNYNYVKWADETNNDVIDEAGIKTVLQYTAKTLKACPTLSLKAFFQLTGMVWKIDGDITWDMELSASSDKTEIKINEKLTEYLRRLVKTWGSLCQKSVLKYPFYFLGWMNLALVAFATARVQSIEQAACMLHAVPVLCYNFGTALLLTGFDWRFFYYTFPIIIPLLFLMLQESA